jgi:parvulin-like peptidyl-prolyl isomerase
MHHSISRYLKFFAIAAILFLFGMAACRRAEQVPNRVVASINDFKITEMDLSDQFRRTRGESALAKADQAAKRAVLDNMINEQIKLLEAYRLGIDKEEKLAGVIKEKEREIAGKALRLKETEDKIITEELLQRYYQWSDRELDLRYMKFFAGNTTPGRQAAEQKAEKIYQQVSAGASFNALAAQYSEHDAAKTDSGKAGRIDCWYSQNALFIQAWPLPEGGVSKPFFDDRSIWLIKVEKIHLLTRQPYAQARPEILEKVKDRYKDQIVKSNIGLEEAVRAEYHFSLVSDNIDFFCRRCEKLKTMADSAGLFSAQEKIKPLCITDVETTTIGAFLPKSYTFYWSSLDKRQVTEMLLTELNTNRLIKNKAMQMRVNELPDVNREFLDWQVYYLKKNVIQKAVIDKMDVSEETLHALYDQTKKTLLIRKQATVREIFRIKKSDIDHVYQLAVGGNDFAALQKKYCQNHENRNNGIIGPFPANMNGKLGEWAFSGMKIGEISKPFKYRGGYSIIQLLDFKPERIKSFAEAREELKKSYTQSQWEQQITDWLDQAKKNYQIRINL